ncbi:MAG: hypothetical protein JO111_00320 [Caulobacteraceae bacterium]|nr:hypothetical protein [Caulobacteraceae bacterium]
MPPNDLIAGAPKAALEFLPIAWKRAWLSMLVAILSMVGATAFDDGRFAGLCVAVAVIAVTVEAGALWRLSLGEGRLGFGGLQIGWVEVRLAGAAALSFLFMLILGLLAFIVLLAFAYAAAASGHGFVASDVATWARAVEDRGRIVVVAVAFACAIALAWAFGRISLAAPASIRRGRVQVLSTWPLTRGRVWTMAAASLVVMALPTLLIVGLARAGTVAGPGAAAAGVMAAVVVAAGLWLPLNVGLATYLYSRLEFAGASPPA